MLSEDNFNDDLAEILRQPELTDRWKIQHGPPLQPMELLVTMAPQSKPGERYQARLLWVEYPGQPPSLKFRDPESGRLDLSKAWPILPGFRPGSFDACVNWVQEGFAAHPEWRNDPRTQWNGSGNPLLRVLSQIQELLDWNYSGRAA